MNKNGVGIGRLWFAAAPAAMLWLGWRRLKRYVTPANPELAILEGNQLTRGAKRVLAVTAHPDDLEAVMGGTLRLMALAGCEIHVAVLTDGRQQTRSRSNMGEIRHLEQNHAGLILGYTKIHALGLRDLSLSQIRLAEPRLREVWQTVKPDVLFTFDPSFPEPYYSHPDHLTAGRIVLNIARTELGDNVFVYFYATRDTNVIVDITPVMEDKLHAAFAHHSQLQLPKPVYRSTIRFFGRLRARPTKYVYAEGFRALNVPKLLDDAGQGQWTIHDDRRGHTQPRDGAVVERSSGGIAPISDK